MTPISFPLLAASSLLIMTFATAETRPQYGGTLHVAMRAAPVSIEPSEIDRTDGQGTASLVRLLFDTLITMDDRGKLQPGLAISWHADPGNQRWRFALRPRVSFSDGKSLTSENVVASLRLANPSWKVFPESDAVTIELDSTDTSLLAELALPRNSIVKRDGKDVGTGPFVVSQWMPSKKLVLTAREDYWGGRPFVDSIEIEMGESLREQMIELDLGKVQLIEVAPDQSRKAGAESHQVAKSAPVELMALVFSRSSESAQEHHLRDALSLCLDRESLNKVVLQGEGSPAAGLLPDWLTGYEFLFPSQLNLARAKEERAQVQHAEIWSLGFNLNDPVESIIAERIVLNARDAGLQLQLTPGKTGDLRLVRLPLTSLDVHVALNELAVALELPQPKYASDSMDDVYDAYDAENALLQSRRIIPLLHSPDEWGVAATVRDANVARDGRWQLSDVWISTKKP